MNRRALLLGIASAAIIRPGLLMPISSRARHKGIVVGYQGWELTSATEVSKNELSIGFISTSRTLVENVDYVVRRRWWGEEHRAGATPYYCVEIIKQFSGSSVFYASSNEGHCVVDYPGHQTQWISAGGGNGGPSVHSIGTQENGGYGFSTFIKPGGPHTHVTMGADPRTAGFGGAGQDGRRVGGADGSAVADNHSGLVRLRADYRKA